MRSPTSSLYHQLSTGGRLPAGRWAHASAAVGQKLFVFGGAAGGAHGEGYMFDAGMPPTPQSLKLNHAAIPCNHLCSNWNAQQVFRCNEQLLLILSAKSLHSDLVQMYMEGCPVSISQLTCASLIAGRNVWRQLPASKDAPPPLFGHAACSVQRTVFVFGGRHGHKHSRRLYTLNTGIESCNYPISVYSEQIAGTQGVQVSVHLR